jgi:catechol 2,3-dioxygenase-like lactoylglutathione lyase family enzyme
VADVAATLKFYREKLGFTKEWFWDDPPTDGGVQFGKVELSFHLDPDLAKHVEGQQYDFFVTNIDDLYVRHQQAGVLIVSPLERKQWGMREYTITDPNGYHLRFGEPFGPIRAESSPKRHISTTSRGRSWSGQKNADK